MRKYIEKVLGGEDLTINEMIEASRLMFSKETKKESIAAFLIGLKQKKEATTELTGLVHVMREKAIGLPVHIEDAMDNCGTGGDGSSSFNISTTSAFVLAGAGLTVCKHGNRSISSKTGSADVLEHLGVDLFMPKDKTYQLLKENGIAFLFAQTLHPQMKEMMTIRQALFVPTIFNLIGPLINPVRLTTQLVGIYRRDFLMEMAETLKQLNRTRAVVLNGPDEMDEAALHGETHCVLLDEGDLVPFTISADDVGLKNVRKEAIVGGDKKENADILYAVLSGASGPHRDTVLYNAGLAIFASGKAKTVKDGIEKARLSIDQGCALKKLENMIAFSKR